MPIMAIDQGTTSTRAIIFNDDGMPLASDQIEHEQIFPRADGWNTTRWRSGTTPREVMGAAIAKSNLFVSDLQAGDHPAAETTVVWNKTTGLPVYNAIVWRTPAPRRSATSSRRRSASSASARSQGCRWPHTSPGPKVRWILDNVPGRAQAEAGELLMGTIDTWLLWNLTNGQGARDRPDQRPAPCSWISTPWGGPRSSRRPSGSP